MFGSFGLTLILAMCRVSTSPRYRQVFPPSVVLYTPSPCETLPRIGNSPPPTYTMSGFDSATAIAPMVPPKYLSLTGNQSSPPSVVLKTPPPVVPM